MNNVEEIKCSLRWQQKNKLQIKDSGNLVFPSYMWELSHWQRRLEVRFCIINAQAKGCWTERVLECIILSTWVCLLRELTNLIWYSTCSSLPCVHTKGKHKQASTVQAEVNWGYWLNLSWFFHSLRTKPHVAHTTFCARCQLANTWKDSMCLSDHITCTTSRLCLPLLNLNVDFQRLFMDSVINWKVADFIVNSGHSWKTHCYMALKTKGDSVVMVLSYLTP